MPSSDELQLAHELALGRERYALESLLEFAKTLTPDLGPQAILKSVIRTVMGKALIQDAFAYVRKGWLEGRSMQTSGFELLHKVGFRSAELPSDVAEQMLFERTLKDIVDLPILLEVRDPNGTENIAIIGFGRSLLADNPIASERSYLDALSTLTSIALLNTRLFESQRERERLESELRLAREIQQSLFPNALPVIPGLRIAAFTNPSELVGGDYYDVIRLSDSKILLCVADVVGKGVTAALTMSNFQAALRALAGFMESARLSLTQVVMELNRLMTESTSPDRFITAALVVLDLEQRTLESTVCGHPHPILVTADGTSLLPSSGVPLGILDNFVYSSDSRSIDGGFFLLLYTDGLTEARKGQQMIGEEGLREILAAVSSEATPAQVLQNLLELSELKFDDDLTVIALRMGQRA